MKGIEIQEGEQERSLMVHGEIIAIMSSIYDHGISQL